MTSKPELSRSTSNTAFVNPGAIGESVFLDTPPAPSMVIDEICWLDTVVKHRAANLNEARTDLVNQISVIEETQKLLIASIERKRSIEYNLADKYYNYDLAVQAHRNACLEAGIYTPKKPTEPLINLE